MTEPSYLPWLRFNRAAFHYNTLSMALTHFLGSGPYGYEVEPYTDAEGRNCLRMKYRVYQTIPKDFGLMAGDCIHNLRAALDNMVWQFGQTLLRRGVNVSPERLSFPFRKTAQDYQACLQQRDWNAITFFPQEARDLIAHMQPYHSEEGHYLYMLHGLWNEDKHKSILLIPSTSAMVSVTGYNLEGPGGLSAGQPLEDGVEFGYGTIPPAGIAADAHVKFDVAICFSPLGPAPHYVVLPFLQRTMLLVHQLLTVFERLERAQR